MREENPAKKNDTASYTLQGGITMKKPKEIKVIVEGDLEAACINYTKAVAQLIKRKFTSNEITSSEIDYIVTNLQEGGAK